MRKIILTLFVCIWTIQLTGQTRVTAEQQRQIVAKIDKSAMAMSTMQCDFTQTKKMKMLKKEMQSNGVMYFKRPNKLRWQYTAPYDYTFILNGDMVHIATSKSSKSIDVKNNKMFRQVADIILNSITGGNLKNISDFTLEIYKSGTGFSARLYPKKKELKQIYNVIEIFFTPSLSMVESVRMEEKTGDVTLVKLNNVKTNTTIHEKVFDNH